MEHGLGWRPSPKDDRDLVADVTGLPALDSLDPRGDMPPVYDQGQLGSCTSNAVAAAVEYNSMLDGTRLDSNPARLEIYWGERKIEGSLDQGDVGAIGRDGFKWVHKHGAAPESVWPYDINKYDVKPPENVIYAEPRYRIGSYKHPAQDEDTLKKVLSNKQTVAFGFTVYQSFESVGSDGIVPMPQHGEPILGGHEVLLIGYSGDHALVRNSWGQGWGDGGYCWFPWAMLLAPNICTDFRTIYRP